MKHHEDANKKVLVIGAGISGLVSACYLAKAGRKVTIIDKQHEIGGRCRQLKGNDATNELNNNFSEEFTFDMGPTWYWMPDIFDKFLDDFKYLLSAHEIYETIQIKDSYRIFFNDCKHTMGDYQDMKEYFESLEPGSAKKLEKFMDENGEKYRIATEHYLNKPMVSLSEGVRLRAISDLFKLDFFSSHADRIRKMFKNSKIRQIMEWPVIFLGSAPEQIPAMYGLLVYSAIAQGTHYPRKGMYSIIKTVGIILEKLGVQIILDTEIQKVCMCFCSKSRNMIKYVQDRKGVKYRADEFIAACDYNHFEQMLPEPSRLYTDKYWETREMSPSCLIFYLGFNKKLPSLLHHNLFFQNDLQEQIHAIYVDKCYTNDPVFYVCVPSKTDKSVIPDDGKDYENVYCLFPLPAGIQQNDKMNHKMFKILIKLLEKETGVEKLEQCLIYKKTYCLEDFRQDYNSYKGNAYGMSNVLSQTAFGKPSSKTPNIKNLYFSGQTTAPGPGLPPGIMSGKNAAQHILDKDSWGVWNKITYDIYDIFFISTVYFVIFLNWCYNKF